MADTDIINYANNTLNLYTDPNPPKRLKTENGRTKSIIDKENFIKNSVVAVEEILHYKFKNKSLLEEALTHSSWSYSPSYERLEFAGDAILCAAFSMFVYLAYPNVEPGQLSRIRAANISTEKLARLAVRHRFHWYMRINAPAVEANIEEFASKVQNDSNVVTHGGRIKAPKILADLVESIAAAVFIDCGFDLKQFWQIFGGILEPIAMLNDLKQQPQPVSVLYELCQKQGKQVEIKHLREDTKNIASVFVDGEFIASGYSCQKDSAKIDAAKEALLKLTQVEDGIKLINGVPTVLNDVGEIEGAKQKLNQLCEKKRLPKPIYRVEKEGGPAHEKKFICSVEIETAEGKQTILGKEKARVRDAENSAASVMFQSIQDKF